MNEENRRLEEARTKHVAWRQWGPYLSERQWGTVREDYSETGDAWNFFTHDHARSRAYRWGEDGIAGISDDQQHLCFAVALWNGKDPILKERLFGLTNSEGQPRRGREGVLLLPRLIQLFGMLDAEQVLKAGEIASFRGIESTTEGMHA